MRAVVTQQNDEGIVFNTQLLKPLPQLAKRPVYAVNGAKVVGNGILHGGAANVERFVEGRWIKGISWGDKGQRGFGNQIAIVVVLRAVEIIGVVVVSVPMRLVRIERYEERSVRPVAGVLLNELDGRLKVDVCAIGIRVDKDGLIVFVIRGIAKAIARKIVAGRVGGGPFVVELDQTLDPEAVTDRHPPNSTCQLRQLNSQLV